MAPGRALDLRPQWPSRSSALAATGSRLYCVEGFPDPWFSGRCDEMFLDFVKCLFSIS